MFSVNPPIELVVEKFAQRDKEDAMAIKSIDQLGEVQQGSAQPVDFVATTTSTSLLDIYEQTLRAGRSRVPPETPPSSYRLASWTQPSERWLAMYAVQASRCASRS
jgi:hypothetical protein